MKNMIPKLTILLIIISGSASVSGQKKIDGFYLNPKYGIYNWHGELTGGKIIELEGGVIFNKRILALSYSYGRETYTPRFYHSYDFTYGSFLGNDIFRFQFQAGLGAFMGVPWDSPDDKGSFVTIGIPLKTGLKIIPLKFISIGLDLSANLNLKMPVYAPMISIQIGKLK